MAGSGVIRRLSVVKKMADYAALIRPTAWRLSEFDFRYSNRIALDVNDDTRVEKVLAGITGRRLTYRRPH